MKERLRQYPFLDGLRAVAILLILAHHIRRGFGLNNLIAENSPFWGGLFAAIRHIIPLDAADFYAGMRDVIYNMKGVLGVEMFFVFSGFLIMRILLGMEEGITPVKRFYVRRFLRIYPAYSLLIIVSLAGYFWQNPVSPGDAFVTTGRFLLFIQNYFSRVPLLEHTWSLAVQEQFYLACPIILLIINSLTPSHRARQALRVGICLLAILLGMVTRLCYLKFGCSLTTWPWPAPFPFLTTLYNIEPLAFGCLLALGEPVWSRWKTNKWWGYCFWMVGAILSFYLYFILDWRYFRGPWYLYSFGYLATGCLIFAAYHGVAVFSRFSILQRLGRHSYGIYLWHYLFLGVWAGWLGKAPTWILVMGYLVSSLSLGILSSKTIEKHFLSLREKIAPAV